MNLYHSLSPQQKKYWPLALGFIVFTFLLSLLFFLFDNNRMERVMFFFPHQLEDRGISAEERYLNLPDSLEERITLFVEESLLGAHDFEHLGILPLGTKLRSLVLLEGELLLDLDSQVITGEWPHNRGIRSSLDILEQGILTGNSPKLSRCRPCPFFHHGPGN